MTMRAVPDSGDRLAVTLAFSILLHAIIIFGIAFTADDGKAEEPLPTLDVILVQRQTENPPEEADFLAQASQAGGGNVEDRRRPQAPLSSDIPNRETGVAPQPMERQIPQPKPPEPTPVVTTTATSAINVARVDEVPPEPEVPTIDARQLIQRSMEMARLEAEIGRKLEAYAKRPRRKFISANTREYEFAAYMQAWVSKVERVGNLNYPTAAREQSLSGELVLSVGINTDGSVESIKVIRSSGHDVLDQAARRIVELAAPYAPLSPNITERVDILHITRTWQFLPGNILRHE